MTKFFTTKFSVWRFLIYMLVIKRDGSGVPFDCHKIINAINKAFKEVDGEVFEGDTATDIALDIGKRVDASPTAVNVEQI